MYFPCIPGTHRISVWLPAGKWRFALFSFPCLLMQAPAAQLRPPSAVVSGWRWTDRPQQRQHWRLMRALLQWRWEWLSLYQLNHTVVETTPLSQLPAYLHPPPPHSHALPVHLQLRHNNPKPGENRSSSSPSVCFIPWGCKTLQQDLQWY